MQSNCHLVCQGVTDPQITISSCHGHPWKGAEFPSRAEKPNCVLAPPQELICQQIRCFPGAAQEDLLYSFCCCCLLIAQSQQPGGILILRGALRPSTSISRALQSLPQWGRAFSTGLDFFNPPGSKAPVCLSTVNPHVLSVSLAFSFGKTKYKTQCKIQIGLGSTFCIRLPQNLLQIFFDFFLQNEAHVLPSSWAHLEFHSFGSNQMTAVCQKTARSPSNRYAKKN